METFLASLALAVISALAYLAYKHHHSYKKLAPLLTLLVFVTVMFIACWSVAVSLTYKALSPFIDPLRGDDANRAFEALQPPIGTVVIFAVAAIIYFMLLYSLPQILEKKDDDKPKEPQPEKDDKEP